jgi:hypothetical protein
LTATLLQGFGGDQVYEIEVSWDRIWVGPSHELVSDLADEGWLWLHLFSVLCSVRLVTADHHLLHTT